MNLNFTTIRRELFLQAYLARFVHISKRTHRMGEKTGQSRGAPDQNPDRQRSQSRDGAIRSLFERLAASSLHLENGSRCELQTDGQLTAAFQKMRARSVSASRATIYSTSLLPCSSALKIKSSPMSVLKCWKGWPTISAASCKN